MDSANPFNNIGSATVLSQIRESYDLFANHIPIRVTCHQVAMFFV